jgi:hypothetical protein
VMGCVLVVLLVAAPVANAQLGYQLGTANGLYQQDFHTLATTGSSNTLPNGFEWAFNESGTGGTITYAADNGASSTNNTYSYGATGSTERAFGELTGATVQSTLGALFINNTGATIPTVLISYYGEEWRLGAADATSDRLDFQYSTEPGATLTTGTYLNLDALDFITPNEVTVGAHDGNAAANRTGFAPTPINVNLAPGGGLFIRWLPSNIAGANDGLAVDDFQLINQQPDADSDGAADAADNCPNTFNPGPVIAPGVVGPQPDLDGDGIGDACDPDIDGDGVANGPDNCNTTANADQANLDGDVFGDACDDDLDNDGVQNLPDNCPRVANPGQADGDGDGAGDACDPLPVATPTAATGQRAAATRICRRHVPAGPRRKRCLKQAKKLPV